MQLLWYQSLSHNYSDDNINNSNLWILLSTIHSSLHYKTHTVTYTFTHFNKSLQYIHVNKNYRVYNGFATKADTSANSQQPTEDATATQTTNYASLKVQALLASKHSPTQL